MSRFTDMPNQSPDPAGRATRRIMELIETYLRHLRRAPSQDANAYALTLIARSPASPAAAALATMADELGAHHVGARVIFGKPAPSDTLDAVLHAVKPVLRGETISARVRWARNPGLLDAHEQMTLGAAICWSGDAMRRSPQRPGALDMVDENAPDAVRRATLAFSALWAASRPLTRSYMTSEKQRAFESLSDMAAAVHRRENGDVTIPSISEDTTRH